ncbi:MAG: putative toxin-antitoxin system toxin component, PIN family [Desulfovibrio sp.]|nr:putative toxin-antitoxin system toxin component, PIN family [Desulfovibrio sp.]
MSVLAVIDTNVLVSALLSRRDDAATVQVMEAVFAARVTPLFSKEVLAEYHEVLRREKFRFSEELVRTFLGAVESAGVMVAAHPCDEDLPDMTDMPFYEVVMEKQGEGAYLVTGNKKHFPAQRFIVTPAEFLKILDC